MYHNGIVKTKKLGIYSSIFV